MFLRLHQDGELVLINMDNVGMVESTNYGADISFNRNPSWDPVLRVWEESNRTPVDETVEQIADMMFGVPTPTSILDVDVADLGFRPSIVSALKGAGYNTVGNVANIRTYADLKSICGIGPGNAGEIVMKLQDLKIESPVVKELRL